MGSNMGTALPTANTPAMSTTQDGRTIRLAPSSRPVALTPTKVIRTARLALGPKFCRVWKLQGCGVLFRKMSGYSELHLKTLAAIPLHQMRVREARVHSGIYPLWPQCACLLWCQRASPYPYRDARWHARGYTGDARGKHGPSTLGRVLIIAGVMSAFGGKADIVRTCCNVCF
jgi:hypothetical protein